MQEIIKLGGVLGEHQAGTVYCTDGICGTLIAGMTHGSTIPYIMEIEMGHEINFLGSLYGHGQGYAGAVFDKDNISPTLNTMQGGAENHTLWSVQL